MALPRLKPRLAKKPDYRTEVLLLFMSQFEALPKPIVIVCRCLSHAFNLYSLKLQHRYTPYGQSIAAM
jgi:hypothetical protein